MNCATAKINMKKRALDSGLPLNLIAMLIFLKEKTKKRDT